MLLPILLSHVANILLVLHVSIPSCRNDGKIVKKLDTNTNTWIAAHDPDSEKKSLTPIDGKQARPTITASIAGSVPPWVMYIDFERTVDDTVICGREGMRGIRFNGSQKVEICVYGFAIDVFQILQKKLNFDPRIIVSSDKQYGSYYKETNTSSGIVREIIERNSDIALDLMENKPRSQVLWFSRLYVISGIRVMYVKTGSFRNTWIFQPFDSNLWIAFLGSVICISVFIWILEKFSPYGRYKTNQGSLYDTGRTFSIFDSANYVWGTYFTGEIIMEKPRSFGSRVTISIISMIATVIIASYSGNLITYLLVVDERPPISNLIDDKASNKVLFQSQGFWNSNQMEIKWHSFEISIISKPHIYLPPSMEIAVCTQVMSL